MSRRKLLSSIATVLVLVFLIGAVPAFAKEPPSYRYAKSIDNLLNWVKTADAGEPRT